MSAPTRQPSPQRGGLVLRYFPPTRDASGVLGFLSTEVARRLTVLPSITKVPGAPPEVAGLALVDGAVVTVLWMGQPQESGAPHTSTTAILCTVPEPDLLRASMSSLDVALVGGVVLATGLFDDAGEIAGEAGDAVMFDGEAVPMLDVRDLIARASPFIPASSGGLRPS